ncbi:hypothetical protein E2F43_03775 [Seongchinamella unica]|uniref:Translocation and assembly module TamB C-terminal domain-containing protein n=1 Tax=Seongchinamella unica TaxID=2547392 RepID=A0A4R5LVE1_9GAMM|nr:translocation/assembly module TamB domain-containing protein [Seongchinamella unica]TDG15362.1 hypothetical protein E2F43_03775 [Seongchinamella unica]
MPTPLKLALATLTLLLLLLVAGVLAVLGLVGTESGTALLAKHARQYLGNAVSWQQLEGRITGPLHISGLRYQQPELSFEAEHLELDWRPGALLRGRLELITLRADGIDLALNSTATDEPATPFDPSSISSPVDIFLEEVQLTRLTFTQDGASQQVDSIRLAGSLAGESLTLDQLLVHAPQGQLSLRGTTRFGASMPLELYSSWTFTPPESAPFSGETGIRGVLDWGEPIGFSLSYSIVASGLAALQPQLPVTARAAGNIAGRYLGDSLQLETVSLEQPESGLGLTLTGTVDDLAGDSPAINATLHWQGLRWPLQGETVELSSPEGELQLAGSMDDYSLQLALDIAGASIPGGSWRASGSGDLSQLQLSSLRGQLLAGEINLSGQVAWADAPRWQLQLEASGLNPGQMMPALTGELDAVLITSGEMAAGEALQAELELRQLQGELAGYPLDITGNGRLSGEVFQLNSLALVSGDNRMNARGRLSAQSLDLDWQLQALAPGELLAGAAGQLTGSGTVTGSIESPRASGQLHGQQLQLDTVLAGDLSLAFSAGLQPEDSLELQLTAGALQGAGTPLLQSVTISAAGSNRAHQVDLSLDTTSEQLALTLAGGLGEALDSWEGVLASLRLGSEALGHWNLEQQSALALSASAASLGESCLGRADGPGRACLSGHWSTAAGSHVAITLAALPLSLVQPAISGDINGKFQGRLDADGGLSAAGDLILGAGLITVDPARKPLAHGGGELDLQINDQGLATRLTFAAPENGTVTASTNMPALTSLPLAQEQPLQGNIRVSLPDLSAAAAWVPELAATAGSMDADLQLAGTLRQPSLQGSMKLDNGQADIPLAGLQLADIQLQLTAAAQDTLAINGAMRSGEGVLQLTGALDMTDTSLQLALVGDNFLAYNTRDARATVSPDLQLTWRDNTLTLRGEVFVPSADITPTLELSPAVVTDDGEQAQTAGQAIAPSQDVVVVSGQLAGMEESPMKAPFRIDNQIRLRLGEKVNIKAVGFIGRLSGDVMFSNTPQQTELIPIANGKLSVEDGTFRAFGQDLDIRTGELLFNNKPATEPEINLRAVRWIDNDSRVTSAGILLTGPITTPTMELFSRPQLETSEVQSYLLTGRSTRDRNSVLSIGTYVSPRIYVAYGYNTLLKTSEFNSLFTITPRYGLGLNVGEADSNLNMTFTYEH